MALTPPPVAPHTSDPINFAPRMDARLAWQDVNVAEMTALQLDVVAKQAAATQAAADAAAQLALTTAQVGLASMQATGAAASAATAALTANASGWLATTNYAINVNAISQINFQTYRRIAAGVSAIDPKNDPVNWTRIIIADNGQTNVQSLSANLTLDASSPKYQRLTPSMAGLDVILPDASTLSTGLNAYKLKSFGAYSLGVLNKVGAPLGYLRAYDETLLDLISNTTSAGVWESQASSSILDIADTVATVGTVGSVAVSANYAKYRTAALSATLGLMAYVSNSGNTTVVAVDLTTGNLGAPAAAQVDAAAVGTAFALFPLNASQALLVFNNTRMVIVSVAGLVVSYGAVSALNTGYGLFYSAASGGTPNIIKLSASTFLTIGSWAGNPRVTCITISGTNITQVGVDVTAIAEGWGGYVGWSVLSANTAVCTFTGATGNSSPYTNYTFAVSVAAGVPSVGAAVTLTVPMQSAQQPLLPYSGGAGNKLLQVIYAGGNTYARVLTLIGMELSVGVAQFIRNGLIASTVLQSITNGNAYAYSAFAQDVGAFPMGGAYYGVQIANVLDVLSVNFSTATITVTPQSLSSGVYVLTDAGYHLAMSYAGTELTVGRLQLSSSGVTVLPPTVIPAKNATGFSFSIGKNYVYALGQTPSGFSLAYSILLTDAGLLKISANYSASQSPSALKLATDYPFQFQLNSRVFATQLPSNNTASIVRLV